ncbi:hypothetical protein QBC33DRAFT_373988 [Phialemonium atrogriseum]|uniref:Uncharacterized protein n=1 Tax=Phialemonium atrogriseum TaxID=1093897 RepID=A0AAJ0C1V8_9PEZI|nr:uncharacterized protein QBC33DRAFT_373988 [Phialemonium atrogriseum]KAK1768370.1 hypothetical protein QBC33DRAFT_373988 [Phialemonium atrogriseum]
MLVFKGVEARWRYLRPPWGFCVFLCSVLGGWKSKQNAIVHCTTTNTTSENGLLAFGVAISLLARILRLGRSVSRHSRVVIFPSRGMHGRDRCFFAWR